MTLQVFEHQKIRIGKNLSQQQWQALVGFAQQNSERYFKILHNGIQFSNYVGALQVGDWTIEILPKIDEAGDANVQKVLLDMLRECRLLRAESATTAALRDQKGTLLDIYLEDFFNEVERLLREGLTRTYLSERTNRRVLKGKLLLPAQIQKNLLHPERFFTETLEFSEAHPFNRLIYSALLMLKTFPLAGYLASKLQQLLALFPTLEAWKSPLPLLEDLRFNRQAVRYKKALQTALLILQQVQPDIQAGRLPVLAILLDMNRLFEEFIFRQLQKAATGNRMVKRQVPKPFWNRRPLQPDILLSIDNQNIVIDTKWKKLQKVSPSMEDLRQMYVYNQYFEAKHSVLVYPKVGNLEDLPPTPFQPTKEEGSEIYFCEVRLVELVREGRLNTKLGADLLKKIL